MYRVRCGLIFFLVLIIFQTRGGAPYGKKQEKDTIAVKIDLLKKCLSGEDGWYVPGVKLEQSIQAIVSHFDSGPLDTLIHNLQQYTLDSTLVLVDRRVEDIGFIDTIPGVVPEEKINDNLKRIDRNVREAFKDSIILAPVHLFRGIEKEVNLIPEGQGEILFIKKIKKFPDVIKATIPAGMLVGEDPDREEQQALMRMAYIDSVRCAYNDSMRTAYRDSMNRVYRNAYIQAYSDSLQHYYSDSVSAYNLRVVQQWNDLAIRAANEKIRKSIKILADYVRNDSVDINIQNMDGRITTFRLKNNNPKFGRLWLKNEQNDSLSVKIENIDKRTIKMLIDDGVTISRFSQKEGKVISLGVESLDTKLNRVDKKVDVFSPWKLSGDGTVGFTQTYLENWKKGGNSAMSILLVLKGQANYTKKKIKWANTLEIRNGWARVGDGENKLRKNDDKFELASRLGISAFKKWYYTAEASFESQFFEGYKYPDTDNPISAFMAPGTFKMNLGMDYKPHKSFSVFLSPLTLKTVWVLDTARIDQTNFGIDVDKRHLAVPGFNMDMRWEKDFGNDVTYTTKLKAFVDYRDVAHKKDIYWENTVVMQLTQRLNMRMEVYFKYDDNVKFPETIMIDGVAQTINKAKWQIKELFNIGFTYKFSKQLYKRNIKIPY